MTNYSNINILGISLLLYPVFLVITFPPTVHIAVTQHFIFLHNYGIPTWCQLYYVDTYFDKVSIFTMLLLISVPEYPLNRYTVIMNLRTER